MRTEPARGRQTEPVATSKRSAAWSRKNSKAVAPFEEVLALVEQPFEFDRLELGAVLLGLAAPLRLLVVVEIALDAVDLAVEEVDDRPEQVGQIFLEARVGQHRAEGVEDFGELGLRPFRLRQRPRIGLVLAGAVTVEREVVEDMRGRRSGVMFVVGVGVEAGEQGVVCHVRVLSAAIGRAHRGLHGRSLARGGAALDPPPPSRGVARAEAQRRMAAGRLFCFALQSRVKPGGGK